MKKIGWVFLLLWLPVVAWAQQDEVLTDVTPLVANTVGDSLSDVLFLSLSYSWGQYDSASVSEHIYGGFPGNKSKSYCRRGYVIEYDFKHLVPRWVAYHVIPEYRKTPKRKGKFSRFRTDQVMRWEEGVEWKSWDVDSCSIADPDPWAGYIKPPCLIQQKVTHGPVKAHDYNGLMRRRGFARGHLVPYGVSGWGRYVKDTSVVHNSEPDSGGWITATIRNNYSGFLRDDSAVFEVNLMSNVAPQHHTGFNGAGGLWFKLERFIQDGLVDDQQREVWIMAGCIFGPGEVEKIGPDGDIGVPAMFWKIVISESDIEGAPKVLAFLFPHQRVSHGDIEDFLVTIDVLEQMTGLNFFHELDTDMEEWLEDTETSEFWEGF